MLYPKAPAHLCDLIASFRNHWSNKYGQKRPWHSFQLDKMHIIYIDYYLPHLLPPSSSIFELIRLSCLDYASRTHPWRFSRTQTPFELFFYGLIILISILAINANLKWISLFIFKHKFTCGDFFFSPFILLFFCDLKLNGN